MNTKKHISLMLVVIFVLIFVPIGLKASTSQVGKPKLILQVTVDQLRGDLPTRYLDRLGDGGFRYLLEQGTVYDNAQYQHANTETIVGHAVLATGALSLRQTAWWRMSGWIVTPESWPIILKIRALLYSGAGGRR